MKNRKIVLSNYLFILCLVFILVSLYIENNEAYMKVLYVMVLAILLANAHVGILRKRLDFSVKNQELSVVNKQEGIDFTLCIKNNSFLTSPYIYIFLKPSYHADGKIERLCVTVPPRSYKEFNIVYSGKYAGRETLKVEEIVVQDIFQLAKRKIRKEIDEEIAVLPQITEVKKFEYLFKSMRRKEEGDKTSTIIAPQGDISSELKTYKEGDNLKLVHWKLAARKNIYMVRQREECVGSKKDYAIILDPVCEKKDEKERANIIDKTLVTCLSIVNAILGKGEKVSFVFFKENKWELFEISSLSRAEEIAKLIGIYGVLNEEKAACSIERWPQGYLADVGKSNTSKLFITAALNSRLAEHIEGEKDVNVLEIKRSPYGEELYGSIWYLSDDYEVIRNV